MTKVSIFIPAYNVASYIAETIQSVLRQTFEDWDLLILDDCSSDGTFQIAEKFERDPRIKVLRNEVNLGMLENWNKGISLCHNEYFVKLDGDDVWAETFLEESVKVLDNSPNVVLLFTRYQEVDERGHVISPEFELPDFCLGKSFSCVPLVQAGPSAMLRYPILRQGLSLIRRKIFDEIGSYRYLLTKDTQASTDTEFYFRVGCHYLIYCIDKSLYFYRIHSKSISNTDGTQGLNEQKIFEIKKCIVKYYFANKKIGFIDNIIFNREINFNFEKYRLYKFRENNEWLKFIVLFIRTSFVYPLFTVSFYFSRVLTYIENRKN